MAEPVPRLVSFNELRFKAANSNDRARAGMEHAFEDVPDCCHGWDDGISSYLGADAGIKDYPDNPTAQPVLNAEIPDVAQEVGAPALSFGHRLLRSGFGLSILLHAVVGVTLGYLATQKLPDDSALLEGETVVAVEFYTETDSDVAAKRQQVEQDGKEEAVEQPNNDPSVEPKQDVAEPTEPQKQERPILDENPVEQAKLPEPVEKPVEAPLKIEQPVTGAEQPDVLSTTQPSSFQIEAAARQILEDTQIEPLPDMPPPTLVAPLEEKKVELEKTPAQPLAHPASKPRVIQKTAEVKPVEKPVEKPVAKKEKSKPVDKKPEPKKEEAKKPEPRPKKETDRKTVARDGNADFDSTKGSSTAKRKEGSSQDTSQGNSKSKVKGDAPRSNYKGIVQRKLERAKKRVRAAGKGNVTVGFTINANGSISDLRIKKSSGKPALDKGALDVVKMASPFPAIPAEEDRASWPMSVPMTFKGN